MDELLQNDLFHLVFGVLAAIFLLSALVNAIRSRIRNNRRETASMIRNNGNTGNEHAPVRLENPFASLESAAGAPRPAPAPVQTPAPASAQTPAPASATAAAAGNPADPSVKAPADDDEVYVWR